jgi:hypothetical protein
MSVNPSVESLRAQATRDREFFKAQSQRLIEIQQSDPNTLNDVDRNALSNWDKSVVTDCNRQLLRLEDIKQPSPEERAVMKELHELIILGDHIMEKRNLVRAELNDRLNAVKKCKASKSAPMHGDKVKPATMSLRETSEVTDQTATVRTTSATTGAVPETVSVPTASVDTPHTLPDGQMNDPGTGSVHDSIDGEAIGPTILYETLGVEPDATLNEIKKYDLRPNIPSQTADNESGRLGR